MAVPPERPQPASAELPVQSAPQQVQHVPRGVDVPVPEVALHRLLVQRKMFRVHLSAIFMLASFGLRNFRISSISFTSFLDGCSFVRMSTSSSFLCIFVKSRAFFRRLCSWSTSRLTGTHLSGPR